MSVQLLNILVDVRFLLNKSVQCSFSFVASAHLTNILSVKLYITLTIFLLRLINEDYSVLDCGSCSTTCTEISDVCVCVVEVYVVSYTRAAV